jgi:hypothetical protein
MRKSWRQKKKERISEIRAEAGRRGNAVKARMRMELAERKWVHVRTVETRNPDGSLVASWKIYATCDLSAPLGVDFGDGVHRLMAGSRLNALIGRKMYSVSVETNQK